MTRKADVMRVQAATKTRGWMEEKGNNSEKNVLALDYCVCLRGFPTPNLTLPRLRADSKLLRKLRYKFKEPHYQLLLYGKQHARLCPVRSDVLHKKKTRR